MAVDPGRKRLAKYLRLIARIIGGIITVFFLWFLIGETVMSIPAEGFTFDVESLFIVVSVIIALAGYIVSWWQERGGGSLLILSYLLLSFSPTIHSLYYGPGFQFYAGMFLLALPFLIAGILFLIYSQLSKRTS
jgi:hypothetical protein